MEEGLGRKNSSFRALFSNLEATFSSEINWQKWSSWHTVFTLVPSTFGTSNDANYSSWMCMWMGNCVDLKICRLLICWWDFSHHPLRALEHHFLHCFWWFQWLWTCLYYHNLGVVLIMSWLCDFVHTHVHLVVVISTMSTPFHMRDFSSRFFG